MRLSNHQGELYALIDSGASHSLMSQATFDRLFSEPLSVPEVSLKSVTGHPLEITGTCELTLEAHVKLQVTHRFHIVSDPMPYDAILGLDFLADPTRDIRHELSSFVLTYGKIPIPLFDAKLQQPCPMVTEVRVRGRHQYAGPGAITFIKVRVDSNDFEKADCFEFHAHTPQEGSPIPLACVFDAHQLNTDALYVGVVNKTERGVIIKDKESIGYLVPVNIKPFSDTIAAIETELNTQGGKKSSDTSDTDGSKPQRVPPRENEPGGHAVPVEHSDSVPLTPEETLTGKNPDAEEFLKAFKYGDNLTEEQLRQVQEMLLQYRDCFAMEGDVLGLCNRITHRIDTVTEEPVVSAPYRIPKSQEAAVKEIVQKMLDQGLIQKSNSEYSSPVVLVEKPDKSLRFCVNYQKLNAITKKRTFPLPSPDELLAKIGENHPQWFSTSDLAAAFHQVPLREEDKCKTAFILPFGLYTFNVLPMGLSGSPWTFARLGQEIFGKLLDEDGLALFIDDLCLYGPTFEHHLELWKKALGLLRQNNLKLKPTKTHLFSNTGLKFLGHQIHPDGITPNPAKLDAIAQFPTPTTVKQVRSYTALCSFFRKFAKGFATLAAPLNALTRKGVHFKWEAEHAQAFESLKDALVNSSLLAYPDFQSPEPFIIATDASDVGLGGWISQEQGGKRRPIAFYSRTFTTAEKNYSTIEKEALAIVTCIKAFHYYVHGRHFLLESDHAPLKYVLSHAQKGRVQNTRLERWKLALQGLDMKISYVPSSQNVVADSLSRNPLPISWKDFQDQVAADDPDIGIGVAALFPQDVPPDPGSPMTTKASNRDPDGRGGIVAALTEDTPVPGDNNASNGDPHPQDPAQHTEEPVDDADSGRLPDPPDIKLLQRQDPLWQPLIDVLEGKPSQGNLRLWKQLPDYALNQDGVLIYQPTVEDPKTVIPKSLVAQLIAECHSHPLAGHYNAKAVIHRLQRSFYWPNLPTDVKNFCASCIKCHGKKTNRRDKPAPLGTTPPSYGPWETVHTDLVGPLSESRMGHVWILLIVCAFTKFVELVPLKDSTAESVAKGLVSTFHRYGIPFNLVSDNGVQYRSKLLASINDLLGVRHVFISAYHAQANANVERMCGVVKNALATALDRTQRDWDTFLGATQYAVNSSLQATNRWSPAFLMYGRHFRLPIEQTLLQEPSSISFELEDLVTELRERQFDAITHVIEHQKSAREYQRNWYNRKAKEKGFNVGDRVFVYRPVTKKGQASKLTHRWEAGYVVERKLTNELTYEVRKPGSRKPAEKVHVNRLKPQPESHVYREGQKTAQAIRNLRATNMAKTGQQLGTDPENLGGWVVLKDDSSEWEEDRPPPDPTPGKPSSDSGVTTILETTVRSYHSSDSSNEGDIPSLVGTPPIDEVYTEIDEQPTVRGLRRSRRTTRKPSRYSP